MESLSTSPVLLPTAGVKRFFKKHSSSCSLPCNTSYDHKTLVVNNSINVLDKCYSDTVSSVVSPSKRVKRKLDFDSSGALQPSKRFCPSLPTYVLPNSKCPLRSTVSEHLVGRSKPLKARRNLFGSVPNESFRSLTRNSNAAHFSVNKKLPPVKSNTSARTNLLLNLAISEYNVNKDKSIEKCVTRDSGEITKQKVLKSYSLDPHKAFSTSKMMNTVTQKTDVVLIDKCSSDLSASPEIKTRVTRPVCDNILKARIHKNTKNHAKKNAQIQCNVGDHLLGSDTAQKHNCSVNISSPSTSESKNSVDRGHFILEPKHQTFPKLGVLKNLKECPKSPIMRSCKMPQNDTLPHKERRNLDIEKLAQISRLSSRMNTRIQNVAKGVYKTKMVEGQSQNAILDRSEVENEIKSPVFTKQRFCVSTSHENCSEQKSLDVLDRFPASIEDSPVLSSKIRNSADSNNKNYVSRADCVTSKTSKHSTLCHDKSSVMIRNGKTLMHRFLNDCTNMNSAVSCTDVSDTASVFRPSSPAITNDCSRSDQNVLVSKSKIEGKELINFIDITRSVPLYNTQSDGAVFELSQDDKEDMIRSQKYNIHSEEFMIDDKSDTDSLDMYENDKLPKENEDEPITENVQISQVVSSEPQSTPTKNEDAQNPVTFDSDQKIRRKRTQPDGLLARLKTLLNKERSSARIWQHEQSKIKFENDFRHLCYSCVEFKIVNFWKEASHTVLQCLPTSYQPVDDCTIIGNNSFSEKKLSDIILMVVDQEYASLNITGCNVKIFYPWQMLRVRKYGIPVILSAFKFQFVQTDISDGIRTNDIWKQKNYGTCSEEGRKCRCVLPEQELSLFGPLLSLDQNFWALNKCDNLCKCTMNALEAYRGTVEDAVFWKSVPVTSLWIDLEILWHKRVPAHNRGKEELSLLVLGRDVENTLCLVFIKESEVSMLLDIKRGCKYTVTGVVPYRIIYWRKKEAMTQFLKVLNCYEPSCLSAFNNFATSYIQCFVSSAQYSFLIQKF